MFARLITNFQQDLFRHDLPPWHELARRSTQKAGGVAGRRESAHPFAIMDGRLLACASSVPCTRSLNFSARRVRLDRPYPPTKGEVQLANAIRQQVRLPVQRVKVTPSSVYIRVKTIKALISVMARGKARIKVHPLLLWSQREPP